jgi:hypothetical protein
MSQTKTEGWANPSPFSSRSKFHYFTEDRRSLCGKWAMLGGEFENDKHEHPDNCAACKRKRTAAENKK